MKIKKLELGLMEIQAENQNESQAVCGILELLWQAKLKLPGAVLNQHGNRGGFNWCVIPDGGLAGKHEHQPGMNTNIKAWRKLPDFYKFKRAGAARK